MYLGGAVGVRGKSAVWGNALTISGQTIKMTRKTSETIFEIPTASVRGFTYTGEQRANDGVAVVGFMTGGLLGMLLASSAIKSTDFYLVFEYGLPDQSKGAVLLRLHKNNRREIIDELRKVTQLK